MNAERVRKRIKVARVTASAIEIWCRNCDREDPIPAANGSFLWTYLPERITCPDCGVKSPVSGRIEAP